MVDLNSQYERIKTEIDVSIQGVLLSSQFIKGNEYNLFQEELAQYLEVKNVVACANGTDALQIAMMALALKPGDEVIVPAFTYIATAEVIALLGLKPVLIDVNPNTFNVEAEKIEEAITRKTRLIVPVHLFGQCTDMEPILELSKKHGLAVVEDNAQAIGAKYTFKDGSQKFAGAIGNIGTTSFFPSKNLGCFGDGGALYTDDTYLATKARMIANHGQSTQYIHDVIGINSRLDGLQAAILRVKLKHLKDFEDRRNKVANCYDEAFIHNNYIQTPCRQKNSTHVFHQYTLKIKDGLRNALKEHLAAKGVPSMIYYPMPLHYQNAYKEIGRISGNLEISEKLCEEVLSLPIHTEMEDFQLNHIVDAVNEFFIGK